MLAPTGYVRILLVRCKQKKRAAHIPIKEPRTARPNLVIYFFREVLEGCGSLDFALGYQFAHLRKLP